MFSILPYLKYATPLEVFSDIWVLLKLIAEGGFALNLLT